MSSIVVGSVAEAAKTDEDGAPSAGGADSGSGSCSCSGSCSGSGSGPEVCPSAGAGTGEDGTVPAWPVVRCDAGNVSSKNMRKRWGLVYFRWLQYPL